jgi:energy-coupling factor transporter ATP-binding protein EcfA2
MERAGDLEIHYFNPAIIPDNCIILIIGKRGCGKSTVAEDIMSHFTHITEGICLSKTDKMNGFWGKHVPELFIHHEYDKNITLRLLAHQARKWERYKRKCSAEGRVADPADIPPAFAIFDDVTFDKTFLRDKATRELFMNGRHYRILVVITCQYLMDIGPDLRNQIDFVFVLKDNIKNNREKIYEYFAGVFPTFASFQKVFIKCTEDREAMVLHNSSLSHKVGDCVFFYKARPNLHYRLGCDEYWRFSNQNYDADRDARDAERYAGMTQRDLQRARETAVRKVYPGAQTAQAEPRLLASESALQEDAPVHGGKRRKGGGGDRDSDSDSGNSSSSSNDEQGEIESDGDWASFARFPVPRRDRVPQPRVDVTSRRGRDNERLKTAVDYDILPVEPFGDDLQQKPHYGEDRVRHRQQRQRLRLLRRQAREAAILSRQRQRQLEVQDQLAFY